MSVLCEIAAPFIANSAVEERPVTRVFRTHVAGCLKCQAREVAMTRIAREMSHLSEETLAAPADLEWRVMSSLEGELAVARSIKAPVALVAAAASMVIAVLIWRLRPRPQN